MADGPQDLLTHAQAVQRLRTACRDWGQKIWCDAHGLSTRYVRQIISGRKPMTKCIALEVGLRPVPMFASARRWGSE